MRVLLVKMSSLGDVVHALPAVTDAAQHGVRFDWVVEEAFTDIPSRHPAVERVIPFALRRWRHDRRSARPEGSAFVKMLRSERYDVILDAQGLLKSALVTRLARGRTHIGFSASSAREPAASLFYNRGIDIAKGQHAIIRLRQLFADALGYTRPQHAPVCDLSTSSGDDAERRQRLMLLHGTTWESKHWPETMWIALARLAGEDGFEVVLPWGDDMEHERADKIAASSGARVLPAMNLAGLTDEMTKASLVIGVDSGLPHLAAALGLPTLGMYGSTDSSLTGVLGERAISLQADFACSPCLKRHCEYTGAPYSWQDQSVNPPCFAALPPDLVWQKAKRLHASGVNLNHV